VCRIGESGSQDADGAGRIIEAQAQLDGLPVHDITILILGMRRPSPGVPHS